MAVTLALGGCAGPPPSPPDPVPVPLPHYYLVADYCDRLETDALAAEADLVVPDDLHDLDRQAWDERYDYASCSIRFETADGRFDDVPLGQFRATGAVTVHVFADPGVSEDRYHVMLVNSQMRADARPTTTNEPARGWWDEGFLERRVNEVLLEPEYRDNPDLTFLVFARGAWHHNLLLEVSLSADVPTDDLDEIDRLFTELTQEIADRAMEALELTTVTVTPSPPA